MSGFRVRLHADLVTLQHIFKGIAQERQCQRARPVDIKMVGITALWTVFDNIAPPAVFQRCRHMVWHNVEDQTQPGLFELVDHAIKPLAPANGRVDFIGVCYVITVGGPCGGGKNRRGIQVAHAETFKIGHQCRGAIKGHAVTKLNTVGGRWNGHCASPDARRTTIECGGSSVVIAGRANSVLPGRSGAGRACSPGLSAIDNVPPGNVQRTAR